MWWAPVPLERDSLLLTFGDSTGPGVLRVLTPHGGTDPRWSPDGSRVSFVLGRTWFDVRVGETTAADTAAHRDVVVLVPHDRPEGTLLLSGARVITMSPRGVLARGDVLISGDRITAVGPVATLNVPRHTTRLDITGATVLPGYIATHEHLLGDALGVPAPPRRWDFLLALAYGVTTVLDPQTVSTPAQLSDADRVAAGDLVGPRYLGTGHAVMDQQLDTWDETRDLVREYSRGYHSGFLKERGVGQRLLRQWVAQAAAEERLTSVGHWNHDLVSMILDGYSGIEHTTFMPWHDDVVQLIARSGTIYTPTNLLVSVGPTPVGYFSQRTDMYRERRLWRFAPKDFLDVAVLSPQIGPRPLAFATDYAFPVEAASAVKLAQAGGQVGIATDGALPGLGEHWEIWLQVIGGMVPLQALRSATLTGAVAVGLERDLGSIEPGKLADLQVLDRNPLVDIHNTNTLRYVMKDGRLYKAATLDEIWPERRPLVRGLDDQPWWWADAPPGTLDTGPRRRQ